VGLVHVRPYVLFDLVYYICYSGWFVTPIITESVTVQTSRTEILGKIEVKSLFNIINTLKRNGNRTYHLPPYQIALH
jgi:hypothetical protein